jgi:hypothetical protein
MPDKMVKNEALDRMLDMIRTEESAAPMPELPAPAAERPDAVVCQACGRVVDTMTGEDLGPADGDDDGDDTSEG